MGTFTVLRDIGETLKAILKQNISELSNESSIIFESPADIKPASETRLSIFLYQIAENSSLKNMEPEPVGLDQMQCPPLVVDLFYLFTPYAQIRETEFIILERVMQIFHDNPVLRNPILQGNLERSGNSEIRVLMNTLSSTELGELWQRFMNAAFKLSVSYMLTPVKIPSEKKKDITRVIEKDISFYLMEKRK